MKIIKVKTLLEKNRQELLSKQKREAPKRIQRATSYSINDIKIDAEAFVNDWLVITTTISGNGSSYTDSIAFKNVVNDLVSLAKTDSSHYVNSKLIIRSIKRSLDKQDIYISCNCPDFTFTYDYWSTKDKFKWGKLQNSNGQGIRNPNNDKGSMCKHLYALLRSNTFLDKISDKIMRTIIANIDVLVKKFNINLEEFIVNSDRYDRLLKMNIDRTKSGKFTKKEPESNVEEKDESIIPNHNTDDHDINILLQYYTNEQILELLKDNLSESEYIQFIRKYGKDKNDSLEEYLINNISKNKLLDLIEDFNIQLYNLIINEIIISIYLKGDM